LGQIVKKAQEKEERGAKTYEQQAIEDLPPIPSAAAPRRPLRGAGQFFLPSAIAVKD